MLIDNRIRSAEVRGERCYENGNTTTTTCWPDFTSKLVHGLAFGTPKFYIAPYDKINHELANLCYIYDVKSGRIS